MSDTRPWSATDSADLYRIEAVLGSQAATVEAVETLRGAQVVALEEARSARLRAERLRQAILKRAFEGKLVPQNPADEPASVLLGRIREAKAKGGRQMGLPGV